ncbi:hypothetical protein [Aquimarina celericrescens]|uniref:Thymidylate synthase n=1 Tax=Aquimarina celericrescens TaxID=1964542 RepID=A0ABW5AUG6_9FLAO|nr:hypothetical protein [Aquimarina celericrescens]
MEDFSNEFCQMQLYERFVVLTVNENVNFTLEKASVVRNKLSSYYESADFLMISYRKHKHKVSPEIYKQGLLPNMKGLAVVSSNDEERDQAIIEQPLYEKSFVFFSCLEDAKSWAKGYF